jgi:hypothetical protein
MNEPCATGGAEQENARIARRSWELYQAAPEGTAAASTMEDSVKCGQSGRSLSMQIEKEWALALARFEAFRNVLRAGGVAVRQSSEAAMKKKWAIT